MRRQEQHLSLAGVFTASILSSCFLLTQAQGKTEIFITVDPKELSEGQSVTLTPRNVDLKQLYGCIWFRGTFENKNRIFTYTRAPFEEWLNGPAFTGREAVDPLCSLHITPLRLNDSGIYTLTMGLPVILKTGKANLIVSASPTSGSSGALTGTIIGSLAVILVLMGTLACVFLRVRPRKDKASTTTSVAKPTPQIYENLLPPGQRKPEIDRESSSEATNVYVALQPTRLSVYEEIKR